MPRRLRPCSTIAADAILVGDPGRALLLAQELLEQPKMSNHARGLWGYWGKTSAGRELTVQATGMGGPSAVLVLEDLVELGLRRAIRVGTCVAGEQVELGGLLLVSSALAESGERHAPDEGLNLRLGERLGGTARACTVASFDSHPASRPLPGTAVAADMQTAPLFAAAVGLAIEVGAVLIAAELRTGAILDRDLLVERERLAGKAARSVLSA